MPRDAGTASPGGMRQRNDAGESALGAVGQVGVPGSRRGPGNVRYAARHRSPTTASWLLHSTVRCNKPRWLAWLCPSLALLLHSESRKVSVVSSCDSASSYTASGGELKRRFCICMPPRGVKTLFRDVVENIIDVGNGAFIGSFADEMQASGWRFVTSPSTGRTSTSCCATGGGVEARLSTPAGMNSGASADNDPRVEQLVPRLVGACVVQGLLLGVLNAQALSGEGR
mmetsp:Transcript_58490/g.163949  ORF Transcript_58490/g.163949 Transcript_58490/m.163949 type:complete len:228 (-) Transcript_58490:670-1353(-)